MDKDRVKGKAKDIKGRVQRQAGEWTGSEEQQAKGTLKQAEGTIQNVAGQAKDTGRDVMREAERQATRRRQRAEDVKHRPRGKRAA